jgi:hypothetical protein
MYTTICKSGVSRLIGYIRYNSNAGACTHYLGARNCRKSGKRITGLYRLPYPPQRSPSPLPNRWPWTPKQPRIILPPHTCAHQQGLKSARAGRGPGFPSLHELPNPFSYK